VGLGFRVRTCALSARDPCGVHARLSCARMHARERRAASVVRDVCVCVSVGVRARVRVIL
jgi:hypothetical protein